MGYLDYAGLQYLWGKLKEKFAPKSHSHDDRYYTESEMDGKLNSKVNNNEAGANGLLSKLSVWTATPTDDTYFMRQDTGGGNSFGRVKFSTIWSYIKGKADGVYAAKSHTHTKAQITDFPASLKNPTALTIQTNGATAATYDGSSAKTVNITKGNIGLGNVDNTADKNKSVASAAKLTTARTVSGGSDITLSFNYDGSGNSTANIEFYNRNHTVQNTNNYPFHRFAKLDASKEAWSDKSMTFLINQDYSGGGYGICRLVYRSNADSSNASVAAEWLVRRGFSADSIQVAIKTDKTNGAYCDAFYKSGGTYNGCSIRALASGGRASQGRTWTLIGSMEASGTTTSDKKNSVECWKTIAEAGTALHNQAYSSSASAVDSGYVNSAGTSNSCTGNAATATGIKDYGDTNKTIKIGYAGAGLTTSNLTHIAGYASNGTQIKDVSKDVLKSWIGLGNYLPLSGGTISGQITFSDHSHGKIYSGPTDNVNGPGGDLNNIVIESWNGLSFTTGCPEQTYTGKTAVGIDCREGVVKAARFDGTLTGTAATLGGGGNPYAPMTFNWSGKDGQPTWLWGGNDGVNMYVYNPSNFKVNWAQSAANGVYTNGFNGSGGYIRFCNGVQICWGRTNCSRNDTTINFSAAFSDSSYSVSTMPFYSNLASTYWNVKEGSMGTTSFVLHGSKSSIDLRTMLWIAIGKWN